MKSKFKRGRRKVLLKHLTGSCGLLGRLWTAGMLSSREKISPCPLLAKEATILEDGQQGNTCSHLTPTSRELGQEIPFHPARPACTVHTVHPSWLSHSRPPAARLGGKLYIRPSPGFIQGKQKPGLPLALRGHGMVAEVRSGLSPKAAALPLIIFPTCAVSVL